MNILFLCVGNSARSQIAEALAKDMMPKSFDIRSAGSNPSAKIHDNAISVMAKVGIDIKNKETKSIYSIEKDFINNLDYVITLCNEEICPVVPNATKVLNWPNEDPDNDSYSILQLENAFLKTRNDIYKLLKKFIVTENI
jgi:arsenate reductase